MFHGFNYIDVKRRVCNLDRAVLKAWTRHGHENQESIFLQAPQQSEAAMFPHAPWMFGF